MDFTEIKANDWEYCSAATAGGAAVIGGGSWLFLLRSKTVSVEAKYLFTAVGVGGGGWYGLSGASLPSQDRYDPNSAYTTLPCARTFSLGDLQNAPGVISAAGYGLGSKAGKFGLGAGALAIDALSTHGPLFTIFTGGISAGAKGGSAFGGLGLWQCVGGNHYVGDAALDKPEPEPIDWEVFINAAKYAYKSYKNYKDIVAQAKQGNYMY
jgi:hypothetical protein